MLTGAELRRVTAQLETVHIWPLAREPFFLETSQPGVFVVGDVRAGSVKRVASAVGKGSMAVKFVHEVLAEQDSSSRRVWVNAWNFRGYSKKAYKILAPV